MRCPKAIVLLLYVASTIVACADVATDDTAPAETQAVSAPAPRTRSLMPPGATAIEPATLTTGGGPAAPAGVAAAAQLKIPGATTCPGNITRHGGSSIAHAKIDVLYWGDATLTQPALDYFQAMGANAAFFNRMHEYGVSTGSFNRVFSLPNGQGSGFIDEPTIQAGITQAVGSYVPSTSDIIIVMLPNGVRSLLDSPMFTTTFGGHHASVTIGGHTVPYGVVEAQQTGLLDVFGQEILASHEIIEALTDPDATITCSGVTCSVSLGKGWWQSDMTTPGNNEVADLCQAQPWRWIAGRPTAQMWSQVACACKGVEDMNNDDVLGNGRFDRVIWRPSEKKWWAQNFTTRWVMGPGLPTTGDFDGDGKTEFATFTPGSPGLMSIRNITSGAVSNVTVGTDSNDTPVPGDYDGDGTTDFAVWNTHSGFWAVVGSSGSSDSTQWGLLGDVPVPADYDNDGMTDRAFFRASDKSWFIMPSNNAQHFSATWSSWQPGDIVVPGDFNGDGVADFAFWRPSNGTWFVSYANKNFAFTFQWGQNGDIPIGRDFDGDFITDLAVWRPSNGTWYNVNSSTWGTSSSVWGQNRDVPLQQ
jgi:hypothetical protein